MRNGNAKRVSLAVLLLGAAACEDIRTFEGRWQGPSSPDPALSFGPMPSSVAATITRVSRADLEMSIEHSELGSLGFEPIQGAARDALGEMRLPGEPLRSFIGFLSDGVTLAVVSLYAEERVELRLIRGARGAYGVYSLGRATPPG